MFRVFLRLGLTCFGGPIAHLGYFRDEFVQRRGWLDDATFAQLLALCQFLPGPASSQLGFAIGLVRGGWPGAVAAFVGFTLPSALLMFALAVSAPALSGHPVGTAVAHGLKLVAVVVVAHALVGMCRTLTPDARRILIAAAAFALTLLAPGAWWQLLAVAGGGLVGAAVCSADAGVAPARVSIRQSRRTAGVCLALFVGGLGLALATHGPTPGLGQLAASFYRAGALVFGGGHVVLPLLQDELVATGWMRGDVFLLGYGAAQGVPGPMFSLAAYLGASLETGSAPALGATVALACMFLPGFLLLGAVLPVWAAVSRRAWATRVVMGANAAVVGLLASALHDPVWRQGVTSIFDLAVVAVGLAVLVSRRVAVLWVVAACVVASVAWSSCGSACSGW